MTCPATGLPHPATQEVRRATGQTASTADFPSTIDVQTCSTTGFPLHATCEFRRASMFSIPTPSFAHSISEFAAPRRLSAPTGSCGEWNGCARVRNRFCRGAPACAPVFRFNHVYTSSHPAGRPQGPPGGNFVFNV